MSGSKPVTRSRTTNKKQVAAGATRSQPKSAKARSSTPKRATTAAKTSSKRTVEAKKRRTATTRGTTGATASKTKQKKTTAKSKKYTTSTTHKRAPSDGSVTLPTQPPREVADRVGKIEALWFERVDRWMVNIARYGGLSLVLAGAAIVFTQFPVPLFGGQAGLICDANNVCVSDSNAGSTTGTFSDTTTTAVVDEPVVTFLYSQGVVSGVKGLAVEVFNADRVMMMAINRATGHEYSLTLEKQSSERYEFWWDTRQYSNDIYDTKVIAYNALGTFEIKGPTIEINNEPFVPEVQITTIYDAQFTDSGKVSFAVQIPSDAPELTEVTLLVFEPKSGFQKRAVASGACAGVHCYTFTLQLDPTQIHDAAYTPVVSMTHLGTDYTVEASPFYPYSKLQTPDSEAVATTSTNGTSATGDGADQTATTTTTRTEETNTDQIVAPVVSFTASNDQVIAKVFSTEVTALEADEIKLYLRDPATETRVRFELTQHEAATGKWFFTTDTTKLSDGVYRLIARSVRAGQGFTHTGPYVSIENKVGNETLVETDPTTTEDKVSDDSSQVSTSTNIVDIPPQLFIDATSPLTDIIRLRVNAPKTSFVELYAKRTTSSNREFIGLFKRKDTERWEYFFDTRKLPNGEYRLSIAAAQSDQLRTVSSPIILINNQLPTTLDESSNDSPEVKEVTNEAAVIDSEDAATPEVIDGETSLESNTTTEVDSYTDIEDTTTTFRLADPEPIENDDEAEVVRFTTTLLEQYQESLDEAFTALAAAYRSNDKALIERSLQRLRELRESIVNSALTTSDTKELTGVIDERIERLIDDQIKRTERIQTIARERADADLVDTDNDGITDYDERVIYQTDPFQADTDGDGFTDGAEIAGGYNPSDASAEAVVRFESPKEAGVAAPDLLAIDSVSPVLTIEPTDSSVTDPVVSERPVSPRTEIAGRALPNSFVTLYIFSTPIIVTVKTEADGSWRYRFDKELEDGEHEVYVGMTDNAGKLVAKSEPFRFVKEAQAFTPVDAAGATIITEDDTPTVTGADGFTLAVAMAIVAIGVLLILIGWNLDVTRFDRKTQIQPAS